LLSIDGGNGEGRRHSGAGEFRPADVSQRAATADIFGGLGLRKLFKTGLGFIVALQLGKRSSIEEVRIREIGNSR
jgi:hypothetical protein